VKELGQKPISPISCDSFEATEVKAQTASLHSPLTTLSQTSSPTRSQSTSFADHSVKEVPPMPLLAPMTHDEQLQVFEQVKQAVVEGLVSDTIKADVISQCSKLLEHSPKNIPVLTLRAIAQRLNGSLRACVADWNSVLDLKPDDRFAMLHRASAHASYTRSTHNEIIQLVKHVSEAQRYADHLVDDRFALFTRLISIDSNLEKSRHMEHELREFINKNPNDHLASVSLLGLLAMRLRLTATQDEIDESILLAKSIIKVEPNHAIAGHILWQLDNNADYKGYFLTTLSGSEIFKTYPIRIQDTALIDYVKNLVF
jgi:hypothetical protein